MKADFRLVRGRISDAGVGMLITARCRFTASRKSAVRQLARCGVRGVELLMPTPGRTTGGAGGVFSAQAAEFRGRNCAQPSPEPGGFPRFRAGPASCLLRLTTPPSPPFFFSCRNKCVVRWTCQPRSPLVLAAVCRREQMALLCRLFLALTITQMASASSDSSGSASESTGCSGSSSGSSSGSGNHFYELPIEDGVGAFQFWLIFSLMIIFIIVVDRIQWALDQAVKGDRCLEKLLARVYAELLVFGVVAVALLLYTMFAPMSARLHKIFELVDILCTLGAMLVIFFGIFMFNFLWFSHRLYERQMMASTRIRSLLHADDVEGAASVLKAGSGKVSVEDVADHMLSSTAFKWDYQLPDKFRFHVYLREMIAQAVCDVIDISWITWLFLLLPGGVSLLITGIQYPNDDDDTSNAARITIGLACFFAALGVATSFVCHYNLRVLRRSLGLSVSCGDAYLGRVLGKLRGLCCGAVGGDHSHWVTGLKDRMKVHLERENIDRVGGNHPATAHFISRHKRVTHGALQDMLILSHGPLAFRAFRLWLQTLVVTESMLLALYLLHFRVNVSDDSEKVGFLFSTCLTLLLAPDMVFVQGMIEAYTLPNAEVMDAVMHDEQLFEQDLAYIHQHVDLLLAASPPGLGEGEVPDGNILERSSAAVLESVNAASVVFGAAAVRLDAAFHLADGGHVHFHLPNHGRRVEHRVLRELLRDIDAPISLERLRRLERFLDSSTHDQHDDEHTPEQAMMSRLRLSPEQVVQLRDRREQRFAAALAITPGGILRRISGAPAAAPAPTEASYARKISSSAV